MKDFLLGFLTASTIALGTFTSYELFCPLAKSKDDKTGVIQMFMLPQEPMLPNLPIKPRLKNNDA